MAVCICSAVMLLSSGREPSISSDTRTDSSTDSYSYKHSHSHSHHESMASHFSSDSQGTVICNPDNDTASRSSLETTGSRRRSSGIACTHTDRVDIYAQTNMNMVCSSLEHISMHRHTQSHTCTQLHACTHTHTLTHTHRVYSQAYAPKEAGGRSCRRLGSL